MPTKAIVAELSEKERTRLLYESRQKMEWDNKARERGASDNRAFSIARNLIGMGMPFDKIAVATGLSHEEIEGLRNAD